MGSPKIFNGRRTKLLTADGLLLQSGQSIDYNGPVNMMVNNGAEATVSPWATYANAASSQPSTGTGGSPAGVSISRTTSGGSVLFGNASFLFTKDAANRQGEGASCLMTVPDGLKGRNLIVRIPYRTNTAAPASGDIGIFLYDVTNGALIVPYTASTLIGSNVFVSREAAAYFNVPTSCSQLRLILHVATTTAESISFTFDEVYVGPDSTAVGMAGSSMTSYVPTTDGFGTLALNQFWWGRTGDRAQILGKLTAGTVTASTAYVTLPSGIRVDTAKISSSGLTAVGKAVANGASLSSGYSVLADPSNPDKLYFSAEANNNQLTAQAANTLFGNGANFSIYVPDLPVSGWDANVEIGESATFNISAYLASGTRVTGSAPTQLGQYRSYLRNSSAGTFTEVNGAPSDTPSATNGIRIYQGNAWNAADTSNQPTRYEIFIGQNKNVKLAWYSSAARTGFLDSDPQTLSTNDYGYYSNYDPSTGILTVTANRLTASGTQSHRCGVDNTGTASVTTAYFDVVVSENALFVSNQMPRSSAILHTGGSGAAGYGSTNTIVRRFTSTVTVGTALTINQSSTLGDSVTVNESGVYSVSFTEFSAVSHTMGITLNNASTFTAAYPDNLGTMSINSTYGSCGTTLPLSAGDVIRVVSSSGATSLTANLSSQVFRVTKVSN
jgi:hypothetical protein